MMSSDINMSSGSEPSVSAPPDVKSESTDETSNDSTKPQVSPTPPQIDPESESSNDSSSSSNPPQSEKSKEDKPTTLADDQDTSEKKVNDKNESVKQKVKENNEGGSKHEREKLVVKENNEKDSRSEIEKAEKVSNEIDNSKVKVEKVESADITVDIDIDAGDVNGTDAKRLGKSEDIKPSAGPTAPKLQSFVEKYGAETFEDEEIEVGGKILPKLSDKEAAPYRKPFAEGWYREIVVRGTATEGKRRPSDVYYFTPAGRKLRSLPQLTDYLNANKSNLTPNNFTFKKGIVHKPPFEVVRQAGSCGRATGKSIMFGSSSPVTVRPAASAPTKRTVKPSVKAREQSANEKEIQASLQKQPSPAKPSPDKQPLKPTAKTLRVVSVKMAGGISASVGSAQKFIVKPNMQIPKASVLVTKLENLGQTPVEAVGKEKPVEKGKKLKPGEAVKTPLQVEMAKKPMPSEEDPETVVKTIIVYPNKAKQKILADESTEDKEPLTISDESDDDSKSSKSSGSTESKTEPKPVPVEYKPVKARKSFVKKRPLADKKSEENEPKKQKIYRICGLDCPNLSGIPPTLVCAICQKLFHHECVSVAENACKFVCDECVQRHDQKVQNALNIDEPEVPPAVPTPPPAPLDQPMPMLNSAALIMDSALNSAFPKLIPATYPRAVQPLRMVVPPGGVPGLPMLQMAPVPVSTIPGITPMSTVPRPPPRLIMRPSLSNTNLGIMTAPILPATPIDNSMFNPDTPLAMAPNMDTMDNGMKAQILTLPPDVLSQLKDHGPIDLKINGKIVTVQRSEILATPNGVKVLLKPGTLDLNRDNSYNVAIPPSSLKNKPVPATPTNSSDHLPILTPPSLGDLTPKLTPLSPGSEPKKRGRKAGVPNKKPYKSKMQLNTFLHGYNCMNAIFDYLDLPDLLNASQVCKSWYNIVSKHPGVLNITLEDCSISNWQRFGEFLLRKKTEKLDLIGLELTGKFDKEWAKFVTIVPQLRYLRKISLGQCPPFVVYAVAQDLPYLEVLHAEHITETDREPDVWFTNTSIDLGKLGSFRCLRELRLRGMAGLKTPTSMAYTSLQRLTQLKHLQKLSLTSLKDVDGFELSFLEKLENLEELEIGDCDTWTEETYAYLNKINLKKLHLENGGASNHYLALALPNWQSLRELDLIMMAVDESLARGLARLTKLESLSICPDTRENDAITNRNTLLAVRDLKHLKYFLWCAVMASSDDGEEEIEFLRQGIEDSLYFGETGRVPPEEMRYGNDISDDDDDLDGLEIDDEIALIQQPPSPKKRRKSKSVDRRVSIEDMDDDENDDDEDKDDEKESVVENDEEGKEEKMEVGKDEDEFVDIESTNESENEPKSDSVDVKDQNGNLNKIDKTETENKSNVTNENGKTESEKEEIVKTDTDDAFDSSSMDTSQDAEASETETKPSNTETVEPKNETDAPTKSSETGVEVSNIESVPNGKMETSTIPSDPQNPVPQSDAKSADTEVPKSPKKRQRKKKIIADIEPTRRSNRKRKLKKSDDSSIAFVTLETLISILEFHLPDTDIRVDPIGLMK